MKRLFIISILWVFFITPSVIHATTISWDGTTGLLPSDPSIKPQSRFEVVNYASYLSMNDKYLNITDTSDGLEVDLIKDDIAPILSTDNWFYQVELRMNSHSRPKLDWGADLGVATIDKWAMIVISSDFIGFESANGNSLVNGCSYAMDTTDGFHTYRVSKIDDTISLFVDTFDIPVLSILYGDLEASDWNHIRLAASSGPGVCDYDVKKFKFHSTPVPEPTSILLFAVGLSLIGSANYRQNKNK